MTGRDSCDFAKGRATWLLWRAPMIPLVLGIAYAPWRWPAWSVGLLWIGLWCLVNAVRCGRVHCTFTGPLFLVVGVFSALNAVGWVAIHPAWIWGPAFVGSVLAYVPEWRGKMYWQG